MWRIGPTMKLGLVVAPLLLAGTAFAQAPGDYYGDASVAPPGMAPAAPEYIPPPPPVRAQRWSVGLNVGNMGLAPHMQPDNETEFSLAQLALRYRPWRHLEIELVLGGGSEQAPDGYAGDRELSEAVLSLRYRFNPKRNWNWWLSAGMGSLAVTYVGASDEEHDAAQQSTLQFGVGLERRWSRFALQAELRAVGVAPNDTMDKCANAYDVCGGSRDGWAGGQFTLGGSYYF
jgi:hypothetical protein